MRYAVPSLILLLPFLLAADIPEFKQFNSKEYGFSVLFPGAPQEMERKGGQLTIKAFSVDLGKDSTWRVFVFDYPKGAVTKENQEQILDGIRDGATKNNNGKVVNEKKIV